MDWVQVLGWAGSALLVYSLLQTRLLRLRALNLAASLSLAVFNTLVGVWPMVAMNIAIALINTFFIIRLWSTRHDTGTYSVVGVKPDDRYLQHVLDVHRKDIEKFFPQARWTQSTDPRSAFLILRGDEMVGVVLARDAGEGIVQIDVDYVTPPFRDFSPGEFVFRDSGLFRDAGYREVVTAPGMVDPYYERIGFTRDGESYRLQVA